MQRDFSPLGSRKISPLRGRVLQWDAKIKAIMQQLGIAQPCSLLFGDANWNEWLDQNNTSSWILLPEPKEYSE
jgi:hypothetical protein